MSARFDDPVMRELVKDVCLPRGLRQDVFVRGARASARPNGIDALGKVMLGLLCSEAQFGWEFEVPSGQAALERRFFGPIVGLAGRKVRGLSAICLALPDLPRHDNPGELVGMLVGSEQALPMLAATGRSRPRVSRFNRLAAKRFVRSGKPQHRDGAGHIGHRCPAALSDARSVRRGPAKGRAGTRPRVLGRDAGGRAPEEEQERLRAFIERLISERAPHLAPARRARDQPFFCALIHACDL